MSLETQTKTRVTKVVFVLLGLTSQRSIEFEAVLAQVLCATVLDLKVEVFFSAHAIEWLQEGIAEGVPSHTQQDMTLLDLMVQAHGAGVVFTPCSTALVERGTPLIKLASAPVGATYLIEQISRLQTQVMTY